jgi:hypothetical protein
MRGSVGALIGREAGFRAIGHAATPEPISEGERGSELQDT